MASIINKFDLISISFEFGSIVPPIFIYQFLAFAFWARIIHVESAAVCSGLRVVRSSTMYIVHGYACGNALADENKRKQWRSLPPISMIKFSILVNLMSSRRCDGSKPINKFENWRSVAQWNSKSKRMRKFLLFFLESIVVRRLEKWLLFD